MKPNTSIMARAYALLLAATMLCGAALPSSPAGAAVAASEAPAATAAPAEAAAPVHLQALPLGRHGTTPWVLNPLWFVLLAVLVPTALWTGLAWKRAFDTDPVRRRRGGVRDLRRVSSELQAAAATPTARQLHRWRDAAARTWNVPRAVPTATELAHAIEALGGDAQCMATWRSLWMATERGLFAADGALPSDWRTAAIAASAAVEMPPREHRAPKRREHWLPMVMVLPLLAVILSAGPLRADAQDADKSADAAAAAAASAKEIAAQLEQAYPPSLQALKSDPMDWAAHENVARHDIQLEDWDAAVAHGLAAFLLHASTPARDNLRYAYAQTAMNDPTLKRLLAGSRYARMPTLLSPLGWQHCVVFASLLLCAGLVAVVIGLYAPIAVRRLTLLLAGGGVATVGIVLAAVAVFCWSAYGDLRLPGAGITLRAANLSPVPTNLVPQDETAPVTAGRLVRHQRHFLGWERVAADAELSGWLRSNAVLPLYGDAWPLSIERTVPPPAPPAKP